MNMKSKELKGTSSKIDLDEILKKDDDPTKKDGDKLLGDESPRFMTIAKDINN